MLPTVTETYLFSTITLKDKKTMKSRVLKNKYHMWLTYFPSTKKDEINRLR